MQYVYKLEPDSFPPPGKLGDHGDSISIARLMNREKGVEHFTLICVELQPGGYVIPHTHPFEQAYFCLSGEVELEVAGEKHKMTPNTYVIIPPGTVHNTRNLGSVPERHLEIAAPAAQRQGE